MVIEMRNVTKSFGSTRALDGMDLSVRPGEVHGLLGPNGAGKSTAIRILLGLLKVDGGSVRVLGQDPWSAGPALRGRWSYVPGDVNLWPNLTGGEIIDLLIRVSADTSPDVSSDRDDLIERFDLDPSRKARSYSKGNRQKVALIAAFSTSPDLLILDEPTSGLDPLMEEVFKDCVRHARDHGATVLLSSHILSEAEQLCDRVSVVRAGRVIDTGTLAQLRGHDTTVVSAQLREEPVGIERLDGVSHVRQDGRTVELTTTEFDALMSSLAAYGIETLTVTPPTLEDLFLHYYQRDDHPAASARSEVSS
ncbi:ATP-binding cassette domain-containing protein [Branchiibius sp. NY16-3462-2]|uniref:ABC transporter ATP-binding protein n=1 Tax=Branchiibius sp. NY16-3462-2 TaxID=1807500 RepID=UPI00345DBAAF